MTTADRRTAAETERDRQREEWALCSAAWRRHRRAFTDPGRAITEGMLRLAAPRPGERALDLACGVGNPALALAERVSPGGYVLGLDLSPEMVAEATAVAAEEGVPNAGFRTVLDEGALGVPDGAFDLATCRAGLQYMPDRPAAVRAVRDALRPGGRFVAMTLGAAERCMPFRLTNGIVARHVPLPPVAPEAGPGPVSLSSLDELTGLFADAGFTGLRTEVFEAPIFEAPDPAAAWELFTETAGPFLKLFAALPPGTREAMREDAVRVFGEAFPDGPVRPTGEVLLVCGTKPA
ncbi:methyltransferase domain-containing protein [Actinomadura logoneensis]|uniref:Methyltransferase domain-containing protein n=1 Tax=Actinomadura logoneensis TaxID=2293572 RepID=A0A372JP14_9ACTN|nr:methyltransferase domain-containing protein [Actinomadura logoneensis]RFU41078.1 methyltransferase domain-containing protein [Actinomadura logoneensis]